MKCKGSKDRHNFFKLREISYDLYCCRCPFSSYFYVNRCDGVKWVHIILKPVHYTVNPVHLCVSRTQHLYYYFFHICWLYVPICFCVSPDDEYQGIEICFVCQQLYSGKIKVNEKFKKLSSLAVNIIWIFIESTIWEWEHSLNTKYIFTELIRLKYSIYSTSWTLTSTSYIKVTTFCTLCSDKWISGIKKLLVGSKGLTQ